MNVNVHIERLILDGLPVTSNQGPFVQAAVEAELTRLVAEQGLSPSSVGAAPYLSAGYIQLAEDSKPAELGHQIARAVHWSLTPNPAQRRERHTSQGRRK